ncbi:MAG: SLBB domain-containing protein [Sinimarinibacterium flocculans]|uniref:SLBB domain-containing protein n=1 Tax=Sinimarinibacterium flocculans TaxID=985250 RepID=UPI003C6764AC
MALQASVYVPQPPSSGVVEVHGSVATPGTILLRQPELDLPEAIQKAGGLTGDAYLFGAVLLRKARNAIGYAKPQNRFCLAGAEQQALQAVRTTVSSAKAGELAEAIYSRNLVRVPVRLSAPDLQAGASGAVALMDGDVLVIPPRPAYTYVGGTVRREGPVLYEAGMLADDYFKAAGGGNRGWFSQDLVVLPDGETQLLKLRFWNYQRTAVPPGSLVLFGVADPACLPVTVRR